MGIETTTTGRAIVEKHRSKHYVQCTVRTKKIPSHNNNVGREGEINLCGSGCCFLSN
jgi:hypothetical protein